LQGCYEIIGKTLVNTEKNDGFCLVIGTRKETSPTKPPHYILLRKGSSHTYLSSMYPSKVPFEYSIEYSGISYTMALDGCNYLIKKLKK
jgi:hypothetical protein